MPVGGGGMSEPGVRCIHGIHVTTSMSAQTRPRVHVWANSHTRCPPLDIVGWLKMRYWLTEQLHPTFRVCPYVCGSRSAPCLFDASTCASCLYLAASLEKVGRPLCPSKSFGIHLQAWPWQLFVFPLRREEEGWRGGDGGVEGGKGLGCG